MKYRIYLFGLVVFTLFTSGCKKEIVKENDLTKLNLKGLISSISDTNYSASGTLTDYALSRGAGPFITRYNLNGYKLSDHNYEYSYTFWGDGKIKSCSSHYKDGKIYSVEKYDSKGRSIEYSSYFALAMIPDSKSASYGENTKTETGKDHKIVTYFNENGKVEKEIKELPLPKTQKNYFYDLDGRLYQIKENIIYNRALGRDGQTELTATTTYDYFSNNSVKSMIKKYSNGQEEIRIKNKLGNTLYWKNFVYYDSDAYGEKFYSYIYDRNDNWIEMAVSQKGRDIFDKGLRVTQRTITYY